ncbi:hypothetical protein V6R21_24920 [Limibacter armeniacum]|uniref:hypothetical protein n=1 Tax=Limibacter armeniacum TaxID=466084 RepID=UPI002FE551DB
MNIGPFVSKEDLSFLYGIGRNKVAALCKRIGIDTRERLSPVEFERFQSEYGIPRRFRLVEEG